MRYRSLPAILILVLIGPVTYGQSAPESRIGLTYTALGSNDVYTSGYVGTPEYKSDDVMTIGLAYTYALNHWLELETGLEYSEQSITAYPHMPPANTPPGTRESVQSDITLLNIPLTLRAAFLEYLFINGGLLAGIDISEASSIESQTGVGLMGGIGTAYDFADNFSAFVNPYIKYHALNPFEDKHADLLEAGVRIGVMYRLK